LAIHARRESDNAWNNFDSLKAQLAKDGLITNLSYRFLVEKGDAWAVVSGVMKKNKVDLIVMGTHGRRGFEMLVLGSFAKEIFRRARCPVLTVGPRTELRGARNSLKQILFPTDFSRESEAAEPYAVSLARRSAAQLTLLNVVKSSRFKLSPGTSSPPRADLDHAQQRLEAAAWRMQGSKASTATTILVEKGSNGGKRILTMAKRLGADLIILGVSGPRKIADRLGQTVAYRVVCAAPCPVLTIREPVPGPYFEKLFAMEAAQPGTGSGSRTQKKESGESKTTSGRKWNRG
jgi:nucleotide-binding universal stress UspA family protein